jgi:hypothetical protein
MYVKSTTIWDVSPARTGSILICFINYLLGQKLEVLFIYRLSTNLRTNNWRSVHNSMLYNMKMNPTRFLALSLMALTMTPTESGRVRPTRVSSFGRLIRRVPTSSHLAHVVAHSHICFFFLFAVKTPLRHPRLPSCVLWALPVPPNLTISTKMSLLENHALTFALWSIVR